MDTSDVKYMFFYGSVYACELWMSYPCFDSSDYLYENRTYQNYILRERPITFEDMDWLAKLPSGMNAQRLSPSVPEELLPMMHYVGDGYTIIVVLEIIRMSIQYVIQSSTSSNVRFRKRAWCQSYK